MREPGDDSEAPGKLQAFAHGVVGHEEQMVPAKRPVPDAFDFLARAQAAIKRRRQAEAAKW